MLMKEIDIVNNYKNAKSKFKQIGILAQLNDVSREDIKNVLIKHGVLDKKPIIEVVNVSTEKQSVNTKGVEDKINTLNRDYDRIIDSKNDEIIFCEGQIKGLNKKISSIKKDIKALESYREIMNDLIKVVKEW